MWFWADQEKLERKSPSSSLIKFVLLKSVVGLGVVVHACNPNYVGGEDGGYRFEANMS
jgi:hypothetical protein